MTRVAIYMSYTLAVLGLGAWEQTPKPQYSRTTVGAIIKSPKRMDGRRVEVRGNVTIGFETSVLVDPSACGSASRRPCAIWLKFDNCSVQGDAQQDRQCSSLIERLGTGQHRGPLERRPLVIENVVLRGRLSTVRRDVTYAKSVPSSVRVGFGHLGAYPAQLQVEQMELPRTP